MKQRPLKFRAWHIPTKRLFDVYGFNDHYVWENSLDGPHTSETLPADRSDCILVQFTGLTDKTGAEVYEGDIIETEYEDGSIMVSVFNEVAFREGTFGIMSEQGRAKFYSMSEINYTDVMNDATIAGMVFTHYHLVAPDQEEEDLSEWDATRYAQIADVPPLAKKGLTNWIDWEQSFRAYLTRDQYTQARIDQINWVELREVYFNDGLTSMDAFRCTFFDPSYANSPRL